MDIYRITVILAAFTAGTYVILLGLALDVILVELITIACSVLTVLFYIYARAASMMPLTMLFFALGMLGGLIL